MFLRTQADLPEVAVPMLVAQPLDMHRRLGVKSRPAGAALGSDPFPGHRPVASIAIDQALNRHEKPPDGAVSNLRIVQTPG